MEDIYGETLDKIIFLYERYSKEHRSSIQPFHLQKVKELVKDYHYDCNDLLVREPLIEHTGSLPIVATTICPFLNNSQVDLERALIMLAVHDIGELIVGDEMTFTKNPDRNNKEQKHALEMLPECLHAIYLEIEGRKSDTARFAKAVDKMTPDIVDLMCPVEITINRYTRLVGKNPNQIVATIKEFKHSYMIWNDFMKNLHLLILERIDKKLQPYY